MSNEDTTDPDAEPVEAAEERPQDTHEVPQQSEPDDDVLDPAEQAQSQHVVNNFFGTVDAREGHFGVRREVTSRRATGPIPAVQVVSALRHFLQPPDFDRAVGTLRTEHVVVLAGAEGIGKATSAFALLRAVLDGQAEWSSLSPVSTWQELADDLPERPRGYLVRNWLHDVREGAEQRFHFERLQEKLRKSGAYLVITTGESAASRRYLTGLSHSWRPPDSGALFDHCVDDSIAAPEEVRRARECAETLVTPAAVRTLVDALPRGVGTALAAVDDNAATEVQSWFAEEPAQRDVLAVAALAFVHGLPIRTFESLATDLRHRVDEVVVGEPLSWRQGRAGWDDHALALLRQSAPEPGWHVGQRRLEFRSVEYRTRVVAELVRRYDDLLWEPLREWLCDLLADGRRSRGDIRVQVALGIALLAKHSPQEVENDYLAALSDGLAAQRHTASLVLSWMCIDDVLSSLALRLATSWSEGAGSRRAMTAAAALGGELGIRYSRAALETLWRLLRRNDERVRATAKLSLSLLFSSLIDSDEDAKGVLVFLRRLADLDARARVIKRVNASRIALCAVLSSRGPDADEPAVARLLAGHPGTAGVLGDLWAMALRGGSQRGLAVAALCDVLRALSTRFDARAVVENLGVSIREGLSPEAIARLQHDVRTNMARVADRDGLQRTEELTDALIKALRPRKRCTP